MLNKIFFHPFVAASFLIVFCSLKPIYFLNEPLWEIEFFLVKFQVLMWKQLKSDTKWCSQRRIIPAEIQT